MLIPNVHLETPNYTITRLRHDDLNNSEPLPASFDMVEKPDEEEAQKKAEEARQPRQEAAVKGVALGLPAPMPTVVDVPVPVPMLVAEPSLWSKFISFFASPATSKPEVKPEPARVEREKQGGRRDQPRSRRGREEERGPRPAGEGRDRGNGAKQPRQERQDRAERPQPVQAEGAAAGQQNRRRERGESGQRPEREQRPPRDGNRQREPRPAKVPPEVNAPVAETPMALIAEGGERPQERDRPPRRERGERRPRGERAPRSDQAAQGEGDNRRRDQVSADPAETSYGNENAAPTLSGSASYDLAHDAPVRTTPIAAAPEPVAAPIPTRVAEPASEPVAAPIVREPEVDVAIPSAPARTLHAEPAAHAPPPPKPRPQPEPYVIPPESGLVMVETAAQRARSAEAAAAEQSQSAPRRVRPPRPVITEEPLVMVETEHKD
ncbi:MAG: hypothetical protein ABI831_13825 [Betaproteobacteria bacterium]